MPTRTPHRSVLARLTHTAPHVVASLSLTRSARLAVTRSEVRCPQRGSGFRSTTRRPLRSTGSGRARSPASMLLWDAPTPGRSSRRPSLPSVGDTTLAPNLLPPAGAHSRGHGELVFRFPSRKCRWKRQGLSGSRATLVSLRPVLGPRQDRSTPGLYGVSARPPLVSTTVAPASEDFGARSHGMGTRCLRFAGRVTPPPRKTRFRLLAKLCRAGLVTRRVPMKGF